MITEAQKTIIKEVCSLQFEALEEIIMKPELGEDDDGISYEEILNQYGCTRKDFDFELKATYCKFGEVQDNPELVFTLDELDMLIFRHILHNFAAKWEDRFPKALANLWTKLFFHVVAHEIKN